MKKLIFLLLLIFEMSVLNAQTNNTLPTGVQVTPEGVIAPVIVTNKFNIDYPNANAVWQMDGDNYAAGYTDLSSNTHYFIVYDEDGNLIRKDQEVQNSFYPKTIEEYFSKNHPGESYVVWMSEDNGRNKTYFVNRKSTMVWFDNKGIHTATTSKEITKK